MTKTALITGITGQDGLILAQILQEKNYVVHGLRPYLPYEESERLNALQSVSLTYGDIQEAGYLTRLIDRIKPDEIYNLAAMTHVQVSFDHPVTTAMTNALGVVHLLEALRLVDPDRQIRFYQASSSEMFGRSPAPQSEQTPFAPCSPYGTAKLYAYWMVRNYREAYGLYAANGILFNHESPYRGEEFVTRKITKAIHAIKGGRLDCLKLGNLDCRRDWGYAHDYMEGVWRILQQDQADDFVLATGQSHSVRDFVTRAFACGGFDLEWQGHGLDEVARDKKSGRILVRVDPALYRPQDIMTLCGDATKAKEILGWQPQMDFDSLIETMMEADGA